MTNATNTLVQSFKTKAIAHDVVQLDGKNHKEAVEWLKELGFAARNGGKYIKLATWNEGVETWEILRKGVFIVVEPKALREDGHEGPHLSFMDEAEFRRFFSVGKNHVIV